MRVSKTVREYIEKQVNTKMKEKYAPLAAQEQATADYIKQVMNSVFSAAENLVDSLLAEAIANNPAIRRTDRDISSALTYGIGRLIEAVPNPDGSSWEQQRHEADEIVRNIIVELELGGTKADLERMLAEIA